MKATPQSTVPGAVQRAADNPEDDRNLVVFSAAELPPVLAGHLTPELRGRALTPIHEFTAAVRPFRS